MFKEKKHYLFLAFVLITVFSCKQHDEKTDNVATSLSKDSVGIGKALQILNEQIIKDPKNANLYYKKSQLFIAKKQLQPAFENIVKALNIDSTKSEYYIPLSDCYFATVQVGRAKKSLEKAVALDNTNTEALLKLAELYLYVRKYQESIDYVNKALHVNVHLAKAYFIKGMNQKELHDTTQAISSFQTVVEQDPDYYDAFMQLGLLFFYKKNPLSVQYLTSALALNPQSTEALYARGYYFQKNGEYAKALADYAAILRIMPSNVNALYNAGFILVSQNKPQEAIEYFSKVIQRDSSYIDAYQMRAKCLMQTGHGKEVKNDYKIAEKLMNKDALENGKLTK